MRGAKADIDPEGERPDVILTVRSANFALDAEELL
jgi:hypothetical protein